MKVGIFKSVLYTLVASAEVFSIRFCPFNGADTPARLRAKQNRAAAREQLARTKQQQELNKAVQDKKLKQENALRSHHHGENEAQQSQEDADLEAIILALQEEAK